MTTLEKDVLQVLLGVGDEVIARREAALRTFEDESRRCLNPFRLELLREEIVRIRNELELLHDEHAKCKNSPHANECSAL